MEKVILPKEVAEAIEEVWCDLKQERHSGHLQKIGCLTNWMMLEKYYSGQERILYAYFEENPVDYVSALAYGYEVEKTPYEELQEYYESNAWRGMPELNSSEKRARCNVRIGVRKTLNTLGIEIEGINA